MITPLRDLCVPGDMTPTSSSTAATMDSIGQPEPWTIVRDVGHGDGLFTYFRRNGSAQRGISFSKLATGLHPPSASPIHMSNRTIPQSRVMHTRQVLYRDDCCSPDIPHSSMQLSP